MLTTTPTFGKYLCNPALVPLQLLRSHPKPSARAKQLELRAKLDLDGSPDDRPGFVSFGSVAVESQLRTARGWSGESDLVGKSLCILPLDDPFKRVYSMLFTIFGQEQLLISTYQNGLSYRTRMVAGSQRGKRCL